MQFDSSPLITVLLFAIALWVRSRFIKAKKTARQVRQNQAPTLKPATPAPAFPEAAPLSHSQPEQYQTFDLNPLPTPETEPVSFPAFESFEPAPQREQKKPEQKMQTTVLRPNFTMPKIDSNTLVQAVIANEILARPVAIRQRHQGSCTKKRLGSPFVFNKL